MDAEVHPVVTTRLTRNNTVCDEQLTALLHLVDETGSIQEACQRMDIPVPDGWYLLAQAEDSLGFPLLRHLPGKSILTAKGRKFMDAWDGFQAAVHAKADMLAESFFRDAAR